MVLDSPDIDLTAPTTTEPVANVPTGLAQLESEATALADDIDRAAAKDWTRSGRDGATEVIALDLVRGTVEESILALEELGRTVREVVGRPR